MQTLKEIIDLTARYRIGRINVLNTEKKELDSGDLADRLYWGIRSENITTEAEAASFVYGTDEPPDSNRFRKVKTRLLRRLANTIFFLGLRSEDLPQFTQERLRSNRYLFLGRILSLIRAHKSAFAFLVKAHSIATEYDLTTEKLISLQTLRLIAGQVEFNEVLYHRYNTDYKVTSAQFIAENDLTAALAETMLFYGPNPMARNKVAKIADEAVRHYESTHQNLPLTTNIIYGLYAMRTQLCEAKGELEGMEKHSRTAIQLLVAKSHLNNSILAFFWLQVTISHLLRNNLEKGLKSTAAANAYISEGSIAMFKNQELTLLLLMHGQDFSGAYDLYQKTCSDPAFTKLPQVLIDTWRLFRAYLHYLRACKLVDFDPETDPLGKFRLTTFLNNVPAFSRDKKGMNIAILIVQILFASQDCRYDVSVERVEAIEKYVTRHVKADTHYRSNAFVRALLQLPVQGFHREAVRRHGQRHLDKLKEAPLEAANQNYLLEPIPYDRLWAIALESLPTRRVM